MSNMVTRFTAGGERTIVSVVSGNDEFNIYLPKGGVPGNVAGVIGTVMPRNRLPFDAGQFAADFVAATSPAIRCQLVSSERAVREFFPKADLRVVVLARIGGVQVKLFRIQNGREALDPMFAGTSAEFGLWAAKLTGLEDVVKKVVKFKYKGGSKPGAERLVRVEAVERAGGLVHICGYDLHKDDLKMAYRRYSSEKIDGDIQLVG